MHIMINDVTGAKTINLSYPICSSKEVAVIGMLSHNVQYEIIKPHTVINDISQGNTKLNLSKTYAGRELRSVLEGTVAFTHLSEERVIKKNKLKGITEMIFNLNELDNTDNLEDGRPCSTLLTPHVTSNKDF